MLVAAAILPMQMASAQVAPADPMAPLPDAKAAPVVVPPVVPVPAPPPPLWQIGDVRALQAYVATIGSEGLDPRDYDSAGLDAALRSGDPVIMSAAATDRFNKVASDLALGHVRGKDRQDWHVTDADLTPEASALLLASALQRHDVVGSLRSLLPTHQQYAFLRAALAKANKADAANYDRIRLNMDRWRWLPRDLGNKYIIVNVPSFYATLVENGATRWKHRAIAGAVKTKTPQLTVQATGVILNPWWEVPPSITREVAGKKGYVAVKGKDGKVQRWRQPPGPSNALGKVKFVMQNGQNIYLHDTNARSRFNSQLRALSHGCIRTENIMDLAKELLGDDAGEWTPEKVDETVASGKSVMAKFVKPLPVYIVYFSAAALNDGKIVPYADLYGRDAKVIAALNDYGVVKPKVLVKPKPMQTASR
ncbi:L,D-transpeptidase family protein [Sphingomonas sp.]|uniref:L,D-transpeptidase family protein n=1 Tax=Sphingomonas sp. TaxID=28214 RepID=UPI00286B0743|nr:L,D-transpeptidase family protein [Sphingomonas sp.]